MNTCIHTTTRVIRESFNTNFIVPFYDTEESVCGLSYNNVSYFFVKNLQGDVIAIADAGGNTVARYSYDAWGKCTITEDTTTVGIASINPYRYRSYYYDTETGLYYLQSRYYDPEVGRFINEDEATYLGISGNVVGYNLFAYCENNVVNQKDLSGFVPIALFMVVGAAFGLIFQYIIDIILNVFEQKKDIYKPRSSKWDYVSAGLSGAVAATGIGKMASVFYSTFSSVISSLINNNGVNILDVIISAFVGAICGIISGSGANLKKTAGIIKTSKKVLKTVVSDKKRLMYIGKMKKQIIGTIKSALNFAFSAVANALGGEGKKMIKRGL